MAYTLTPTPMTGGTSKQLKFELPIYIYQFDELAGGNPTSQTPYLYYKIKGTSGNNTIVQIGAYLDVVLRCGANEPDIIPPENETYTFGRGSSLIVRAVDQNESHVVFTYDDHAVITGSLLDWEVIDGTDQWVQGEKYSYLYFVTYRFWLPNTYKGTIFDWPEFVLSGVKTNKLNLDWTHVSWDDSYFNQRDSDTIYLTFTNAPYINGYPTKIQDTMNSFTIDYYIPDPTLTDYVSFGLLDKTGELLSGYKIAPKNATSYNFLLSDLDKENLYNRFNTVNTAGLQFAVRYKNYDGDPIVVTYPMTLDIVAAPPTVEYTYGDIAPITTYLTGDPHCIIEGISDVQFNLSVQAYKGATITRYYVKNGNLIGQGYDVVTFNNVTNPNFTVYAIDSRGNVFEEKIQMGVCQYFHPTVNIAAEPPKTDGTIKVSASGLYYNHSFGVYNNTIEFSHKYTSNISENNIGWTAIEPETITFDDNRYTATFIIHVPNHADTYTIQFDIKDRFGPVYSNSVTVKSKPVFDWGQHDFSFNVPVTVKGDLMVTGQIVKGDDPAMDYIVEQGTKTTGSGNSTANWVYRKWNSGVAECWCRKHIQTGVSTAWGGLYVSGALPHTNIVWPINFTEIPVANITIAPNASGAFLIAGGSTNLTATNTGGYEIARGTSLSSGNFYINYYGIGQWK